MHKVIRVSSFLAVSFLAGAAALSAGENVWTTNGPPGEITALVVDPTDATLFAAASVAVGSELRSIAYRSVDHGSTWTPLAAAPDSFIVRALDVSSASDTVYAAIAKPHGAFPAGYVYGSQDAGSTWVQLAWVDGFYARAMRDNPQDPSIVYAAGSNCLCLSSPCFGHTICDATVLKSNDGGRSWTALREGSFGHDSELSSLELDPSEPRRLLTAGQEGVFLSEDNGETWSGRSAGLGSCRNVNALAMSGAISYAATVNYATVPDPCGVFRTTDGGQTWTPTSLRGFLITSLAIDPTNADTIYAGALNPYDLYPDSGVFRSTNGGSSWVKLGSGLPRIGVLSLVMEPSGMRLHAGTTVGVFDYEIVQIERLPVVPIRSREVRTLPARP
jgi:photosystem II stability/assembly factor-like uncharacterized protein